jgi:hypothetical protein
MADLIHHWRLAVFHPTQAHLVADYARRYLVHGRTYQFALCGRPAWSAPTPYDLTTDPTIHPCPECRAHLTAGRG